MLVSNLDIIQIDVIGKMQSSDVRNVFMFEILHGGGGAIDIDDTLVAWFTTFDNEILSQLSSTLSITDLKAKNLTNPLAIFEGSVAADGDQAGEALPVHDTLSFKLLRSSGITRNGRKSYSGLVETLVENGDITLSPAALANMELWHHQDQVFPTLDDPPIDVTYRPVIVGRTLNGSGVYELDLAKINTINGAKANTRVRTQNTRKI